MSSQHTISVNGGGGVGCEEDSCIAMDDVMKHCTEDDLWIVIAGRVYDVTKWQYDHPGGKKVFARVAGSDCTLGFNQIHDASMRSSMGKYFIGTLCASPSLSPTELKSPTTPEIRRDLRPSEARSFVLTDVSEVSPSTKKFHFKTDHPKSSSELIPGGHMTFEFSVHGEVMSRTYTPIQYSASQFVVIVKHYEQGEGSTRLHHLKAGDVALFRGPNPPPYSIESKLNCGAISTLVLIAGGTGISPIYSIAKYAAERGDTELKVRVISCFRNEDEILLEEQMGDLVANHRKVVGHTILLSRQKQRPLSTPHTTAYVFSDRISAESLVAGGAPRTWAGKTEVVCCGPPAFNDAVFELFTKAYEYPRSAISIL